MKKLIPILIVTFLFVGCASDSKDSEAKTPLNLKVNGLFRYQVSSKVNSDFMGEDFNSDLELEFVTKSKDVFGYVFNVKKSVENGLIGDEYETRNELLKVSTYGSIDQGRRQFL